MNWFQKKASSSPEFARIAPFALFVLITTLAGQTGGPAKYWLYFAKTIIGAWMIWATWPYVEEMRWKISWEAIVAGIFVCALWVGLDGHYPRLSEPKPDWVPTEQFGAHPPLAWFFIAVRTLGSSLVVPPLEEVFYRSFAYRYLVSTDFKSMPLGRYHAWSFVVTSVVFGLMHPDRWIAGILCGLTYQWLVIRKNRLGDAMTAHAITNFLLSLWIIWRGAWSFW